MFCLLAGGFLVIFIFVAGVRFGRRVRLRRFFEFIVSGGLLGTDFISIVSVRVIFSTGIARNVRSDDFFIIKFSSSRFKLVFQVCLNLVLMLQAFSYFVQPIFKYPSHCFSSRKRTARLCQTIFINFLSFLSFHEHLLFFSVYL